MANLNVEVFTDEYKDVAPKECACFLFECLTKEEKEKLKNKWNEIGGYKIVPWWKWCLDNIDVKLNPNFLINNIENK